jgi:hypothetical protein
MPAGAFERSTDEQIGADGGSLQLGSQRMGLILAGSGQGQVLVGADTDRRLTRFESIAVADQQKLHEQTVPVPS